MDPDETDPPQAHLANPQTDAEREALAAATYYARVHDLSTPPETRYLDALGPARRDVLNRLVRGLLRGSPAGLPAHRIVAPDVSAVPDEPEPLSELSAGRLRSVVEPLPDACRDVALLSFPASDTVLVAPVVATHGYDRYRLGGRIRRWTPGATPEATDAGGGAAAPGAADTIDHPVALVPLLADEGAFVDADQVDRIRAELAESVANLALARLAESVHAESVQTEIVDAETVHADAIDPTAGSVLDAIADGVAAADRATAFERIVTDGHPFHPAGKIRRGMSATDGLAYAPEFTDRIDVRFVAVQRDHAREVQATGADRLTDSLRSVFGGLDAALDGALPGDADPAEYAVIPVHPWQYHHVLPELYADQRADGRVVPLPDYTHPATPQLNLRTVVPYDTGATGGPLAHLKLAIDVQTTNVVRTLSPHAVTNGPQITDVVGAIDAAESFERLGLLAEPAATCYFPPGGPHLDGDAHPDTDQSVGEGSRDGEPFDEARHLSALLRSNPRDHPLVTEATTPVVASSLLATVPPTGRPLVCELIDEHAAATGTTNTADAALGFVDAYADAVIPEQLLLLSTYGIALESHLQNSLVVFDGASPVATLVRDFGGIRVHGERLADHGLSIEPYPDSDVDADGEADLYRKLYYALFQNHLAELVATVSHELGVDEAACWARIRGHCERAFDAIRSDPRVPERRVRRDERALFDDPAVHKALTAMRLRGKRHEYVTSRVSNPLAAPSRRSTDADE